VGGEPPSVRELGQILAECIRLQKGRSLLTIKGKPYRQMALYWHPKRQIVIKVDATHQRVVTVVTPELGGWQRD
jgi:hypothetical protein